MITQDVYVSKENNMSVDMVRIGNVQKRAIHVNRTFGAKFLDSEYRGLR